MSSKPFKIPKDPKDCDHEEQLKSASGTSAICIGCGWVFLVQVSHKPRVSIKDWTTGDWVYFDDTDIVIEDPNFKELFEHIIKTSKRIPIEDMKGIEVIDAWVPIIDNEEDFK